MLTKAETLDVLDILNNLTDKQLQEVTKIMQEVNNTDVLNLIKEM